jgi:colanic acid/amylovoran biosynthesis glycosyltransferase
MKIIHIRDKYLAVSFIYFLLKGFKIHDHYILCREIDKEDLIRFPYEKIKKTSFIFFPFWILNKILTVKFKFNHWLINDWFSYYFVARKLKNVNLIHAHMGLQGVYSIPLMKHLKCPLVTTFYGADMSLYAKDPYWYRSYLKLFHESQGIIVEGPFMKDRMKDLGCPEEKIFISKIGIPIENLIFQFRPAYSEDSTLNIFMCATFTFKKGFLDAIEVFRLLKKGNLRFRVFIAGDGMLKEAIIKSIAESDLKNEITLLGRRNLSEIYSFAQDCHVFFHPSKFGPTGDSEGGAPTIILEMQALGLPVISTFHADIPNIIPSENHYLLAEEGNISQLLEAFTRLIDNRQNWDKIAVEGRNYVEQNHSNQFCARKLENYYEEIYRSENPD